MAARTALAGVGLVGAVTAVSLAVSAIPGLMSWVTLPVVLAFVVAALAVFARSAADAVRGERTRAEDIVDCAGESLSIGDTVRAGNGFDGPMELGFGRGVVVRVGRGKAHVRFNDIPEQVHPITPGTLRRLA